MNFYLLLKIWAKVQVKIKVKKTSCKYSQKLIDPAKQSATDALKTASKREILKVAEAIVDLIGSKVTDKITKMSKTSQQNNSEPCK